MLQVDDIIEGKVSAIAFGGEGIVRHASFVIFIPFTAIGECIRFRITIVHASFARGDLIEILENAPIRTSPHCPYFGRCGGCQFQHLQISEQLSIKRQILKDALERIGNFHDVTIDPVVPSAKQWGYRRHITLHLRHKGDGNYGVGFIMSDNKSFLFIDTCPIFLENDSSLIAMIQKIAAQLPLAEGRITLFKLADSRAICHFQFKRLPQNFSQAIEHVMKNNPNLTGVAVTTSMGIQSWGCLEIPFEIESLNFIGSPLAFIQNHPEQSAAIYQRICKHAEQLELRKILDLYCGIGVASTMLGKKGITSTAVEYSKEAIAMGKRNAIKNGISTVSFICADVQAILKPLLHAQMPQLLLLNPPRNGLSQKIIATILNSPPRHLLYVSCMAATLARDLKALCAAKYQINKCEPFDMFPQTTHLETIAYLSLCD